MPVRDHAVVPTLLRPSKVVELTAPLPSSTSELLLVLLGSALLTSYCSGSPILVTAAGGAGQGLVGIHKCTGINSVICVS